MNIMLIGGGGREHAILRSLKKNPAVETVWMLPGNGAMESEAICYPIGANVAEAQYAVSRKDFLNKMYIALKECAETLYWLELLVSCDYLTVEQYDSLYDDCEQIRKILSSITKSTRDSVG